MMKITIIWTVLILAIFMNVIIVDGLILGDYAAPPRMNDNSVNNEELISSLKGASINTYAYLIWNKYPDRNAEIDWIRFNEFLPLAQRDNIDVYAYLVPPSEGCEEVLPYRCDFVQWSEEIARLSLRYPVLKGFIIDDFLGLRNEYYLTRDYVSNFVTASKQINSNLKFFPIIYYYEIIDYMRDYRDLTSGIIYPYVGLNPVPNLNSINDEMSNIRKINEILGYDNKIIFFTYPWNSRSYAGDYASLSKAIQVPGNINELNEVNISFDIGDDFLVPEPAGYHYIQLLVDDDVVWEKDVVELNMEKVNINLKNYLLGKQQAMISFRAIEKRAVYNFGVKISIINISGIVNSYDFIDDSNSRWTAEIINSLDYNEHHEVIVMVYSDFWSFGYRPSPQYVRDAARVAIESSNQRLSSGVITYNLNKNRNYEGYRLISELYSLYTPRNDKEQKNPGSEQNQGSSGSSSGGSSGGGASKKEVPVIEENIKVNEKNDAKGILSTLKD